MTPARQTLEQLRYALLNQVKDIALELGYEVHTARRKSDIRSLATVVRTLKNGFELQMRARAKAAKTVRKNRP